MDPGWCIVDPERWIMNPGWLFDNGCSCVAPLETHEWGTGATWRPRLRARAVPAHAHLQMFGGMGMFF